MQLQMFKHCERGKCSTDPASSRGIPEQWKCAADFHWAGIQFSEWKGEKGSAGLWEQVLHPELWEQVLLQDYESMSCTQDFESRFCIQDCESMSCIQAQWEKCWLFPTTPVHNRAAGTDTVFLKQKPTCPCHCMHRSDALVLKSREAMAH